MWADRFCIVIISSIIAYTITAAIIHSAINIPLIALLLVSVILVYRMATQIIKHKIKSDFDKINQVSEEGPSQVSQEEVDKKILRYKRH